MEMLPDPVQAEKASQACVLAPNSPIFSELSLSPRSASFDPGIAASRDSKKEAKIRCMGGV